ncbi:hypothetical protein [Nitrosomonas communis]|uniref:Uncharacterized protein n=1 Tax=Nitrosomonas communis TaxID=44574 RepID=A0A1I4SS12_9PROT|nr:hypothetical protein [Nitrosomonas communis]SFM67254.1 hypothetical protein SAMN05421863_104311 [Nitrosomonas communis]
MYFSGQGKVFIASRAADGFPAAMRFVGNVPDLKINLETEKLEHKESSSGQRLTDLSLITAKKTSVEFSLEEFSTDNLALALYGTKSTITGSTVTAEVLANPLAVGDYARLKNGKVSSVVVKDSAGTPATLVAGTNYEISSADHGTLKILNIGSYVQPFKADYSYGAQVNVGLFQAAAPDRWLRFEGLNTADSLKPVLIELYKVTLDPLNELVLISDDVTKLTLSGAALFDDTKVGNTILGQFGRVVDLS